MYKIFHKEDNILNVKEESLAKFVFEKFGGFLYEELKLYYSYKQIFSVKKPLIDDGDLDLLLVNPSKPQFTCELEFKRIKIKYDIQNGETINKLNDLKIAVHQANKRLNIGFHKCYLVIASEFYGEKKEANNIFFKKASKETLDIIYNSKWLKQLDNRIGILGLEVTQPTVKNFNEQCGMPIYLIRSAISQRQPLVLTDTIERLYCK